MYAKITAAIGTLLLLCVVVTITYTELSQERVTIRIALQKDADPFKVIPQLPGTITDVKSIDREKNEYEIKVVTRHKSKLLDLILGYKSIKYAQIKDGT
jgi:hypothetical protein